MFQSRRPRLAFLAAALCLFALEAMAHGPTRQKVQESIDIDAPPAEVWAVIGDFQSAHVWLPMVASSSGEGGNDEGATRTLVLVDGGGEVHEELKRLDNDRMMLKYKIPLATHDIEVLPVANYSSTISVRANDDGGSKVIWKGAFYRGYMKNDPPEHLNDDAAVAAVTALYTAGLAHLKEVVEAG